MNNSELVLVMASIVLQATPLIIAVCGETITERAGVVNLSLDGTMLMSAMTGFVVGLKTDSLILWISGGCPGGRAVCLHRRLWKHPAPPKPGGHRFRAYPARG
jgi:general nucleoside transport system permease protein